MVSHLQGIPTEETYGEKVEYDGEVGYSSIGNCYRGASKGLPIELHDQQTPAIRLLRHFFARNALDMTTGM